MAIRSDAKAIILQNGCILLNQCRRGDGLMYYDLPGGGQQLYEPLEQAVVREVLEETGYTVNVLRLAAIAEEIYTDAYLQWQYPDYTHRVMHVFLAALKDSQSIAPSEPDTGMERCVWLPLEEAAQLKELYPPQLNKKLIEIVNGREPVWLGTHLIDWHTA